MGQPKSLTILSVLVVLFTAAPVTAQIDLAGEWSAPIHKNREHRIPGPELGYYTGLPLNDAARLKARTWNASILTQPEQQARPHPAQYSMRGPFPNIRIDTVVDPITFAITACRFTGLFGNADRTVWMDARAHPSSLALHTWSGFSTGRWINNGTVLQVSTTHLKAAFVQRNGAPASARSTMTEYFTRLGDHLVLLSIIDDPAYLEEPMMRSINLMHNPTQVTPPPSAMESVDEIATRQAGDVPSYPMGTLHTEFAERHRLPFAATQGGAATLYPEFARTLDRGRNVVEQAP